MSARVLPEPRVRCRAEVDADRRRIAEGLWFWCPGCDVAHRVTTWRANSQGEWSWNGDMVKPTITPSVLVQGGPNDTRCHSFVTDGRIQFLADSTHDLAGQTVDLPPWGDR